jgi:hypothetical protein
VIAAFAEAIGDLALPCTLTLVIPGVAASLSARSNPLAVALSSAVGMTAIGWLRITGQIASQPTVWVAVGVGLLVLVGFGALHATETRPAQRSTAGAVVGGSAAAIWTPCVGEELGAILNRGVDDPIGVLLPFVAFIVGISTVAIAVALARIAFEPPARLTRAMSMVGTVAGAGIALLLASGVYSDVVARLVIWSL